ncbi:Uncharacterised protein [Corynebacterium renale]|uniref:Uncharacterized protein n=1 Tax=Corynebacterium renale TaxID=1724 RepID=A0A2A9DMK4_9CORY|nr:hypothetical protein ATK06_0913 [Corynebacterium renale]SQG63446.1 Uncharacterised protein [Corynebacterium renale]SQI22042.1 Uncharacterised protein [Corynebacterium renale]STD00147.1 Uncharacterised protein [Corynebacterium renale]
MLSIALDLGTEIVNWVFMLVNLVANGLSSAL